MEAAVTCTYLIQEPFDRALKSIREALAKEDLRAPLELDVAVRINKELGVSLAPCRLLFVDCPVLLLEAATLDRATVVHFPPCTSPWRGWGSGPVSTWRARREFHGQPPRALWTNSRLE